MNMVFLKSSFPNRFENQFSVFLLCNLQGNRVGGVEHKESDGVK